VPKHLPPTTKRHDCPLSGSHGIHEVVQFVGWRDGAVSMEIPRLCLEYLGIREYVSSWEKTVLGNRNPFMSVADRDKILAHKHTTINPGIDS
jgi:hypothetical protein